MLRKALTADHDPTVVGSAVGGTVHVVDARYQPLTATTYQQHFDEVTKREDEKSEKGSRPLAQVRAELRRPPPPGSASFE